MIFIDDDTWPPSMHGTGTEDYFNHAWGMQNNAFPMNGSAVHESVIPGYQTSYRFHVADPIHFAQTDPRDHRARSRQPPLRRLELDRVLVSDAALAGADDLAG